MLFEQLKHVFAARNLLFQSSDHPKLFVKGVYSGFDPTAKSLHIGNLVPILGLILCGQNGIQPYSLIGTATALIGDPTGRKSVKQILTHSEILNNSTSISQQIKIIYENGMKMSQFKDYEPIKFIDNAAWFKDMSLIDFLSNIGRHVKVNSMLSRNCVQSRLDSEDGLNFCEFSYQLMQGYDFLHLKNHFGVNVQIGGSDQWGNMISGSEFIEKKLKDDAAFLTVPLLTSANGTKMGKSSGNGIWLDPSMTCIYDFYQYFASLSDLDALKILPILNINDRESVINLVNRHEADPSSHVIQKYLAKYMTTLTHGSKAASQAEYLSEALFSQGDVDLSEFEFDHLLDSSRLKKLTRSSLSDNELSAFQFLKLIFPEFSNSQLRNAIRSGSIKLNHKKIIDLDQKIKTSTLGREFLINNGKTSFFIIKIE